MELSEGDNVRVDEIKSWLKEGMKISGVREQLEGLGYSPYHISFLLERATGQKFLPAKPKVLADTKNIRIGMTLFFFLVLIGVILFFWPEVIPW